MDYNDILLKIDELEKNLNNKAKTYCLCNGDYELTMAFNSCYIAILKDLVDYCIKNNIDLIKEFKYEKI